MDYSNTVKKVAESIALVLALDPNTNQISVKGSGFIFPKEGLLVTCNHVVKNSHQIKIRFVDNVDIFIDAKIVLRDEEHDLALLKYDSTNSAKPLKKYSEEVKPGMPVLFAGYPLDLMSLSSHQGIISSIVKDILGSTVYMIDGTVNPGNSGCPLMSKDGELIGIINATRRENLDLLQKVENLQPGAVALWGLDVVEIQKALIRNLQLGVGYAVPCGYIPEYKDTSTTELGTEKLLKNNQGKTKNKK